MMKTMTKTTTVGTNEIKKAQNSGVFGGVMNKKLISQPLASEIDSHHSALYLTLD